MYQYKIVLSPDLCGIVYKGKVVCGVRELVTVFYTIGKGAKAHQEIRKFYRDEFPEYSIKSIKKVR